MKNIKSSGKLKTLRIPLAIHTEFKDFCKKHKYQLNNLVGKIMLEYVEKENKKI